MSRDGKLIDGVMEGDPPWITSTNPSHAARARPLSGCVVIEGGYIVIETSEGPYKSPRHGAMYDPKRAREIAQQILDAADQAEGITSGIVECPACVHYEGELCHLCKGEGKDPASRVTPYLMGRRNAFHEVAHQIPQYCPTGSENLLEWAIREAAEAYL